MVATVYITEFRNVGTNIPGSSAEGSVQVPCDIIRHREYAASSAKQHTVSNEAAVVRIKVLDGAVWWNGDEDDAAGNTLIANNRDAIVAGQFEDHGVYNDDGTKVLGVINLIDVT